VDGFANGGSGEVIDGDNSRRASATRYELGVVASRRVGVIVGSVRPVDLARDDAGHRRLEYLAIRRGFQRDSEPLACRRRSRLERDARLEFRQVVLRRIEYPTDPDNPAPIDRGTSIVSHPDWLYPIDWRIVDRRFELLPPLQVLAQHPNDGIAKICRLSEWLTRMHFSQKISHSLASKHDCGKI
jgi:hypothetical protein